MIQARNNGKAAPYPIEKSFWKMVSKDGPVMREDLGRCWIWTGVLVIDKELCGGWHVSREK